MDKSLTNLARNPLEMDNFERRHEVRITLQTLLQTDATDEIFWFRNFDPQWDFVKYIEVPTQVCLLNCR